MKPKTTIPLSEYRKLSDEEVVYRYARRDESQAINCIYERYAHLVLGVCFKYLKEAEAAKDATQQIFIKLLEDLKRFEIEKFKPWLMQVTRNYCLMQLRQNIPVVNNTISLPENMEFEEEVHHNTESELLLNELEAALSSLNDAQRICVTLFYLNKLDYATVAQQTGFTLLEVKSHIQNGRRNLKIRLNPLKAANAAEL